MVTVSYNLHCILLLLYQMKKSTHERLCYVNAILSKHNVLAGVENLGLADCNNYYVSCHHVSVAAQLQ